MDRILSLLTDPYFWGSGLLFVITAGGLFVIVRTLKKLNQPQTPISTNEPETENNNPEQFTPQEPSATIESISAQIKKVQETVSLLAFKMERSLTTSSVEKDLNTLSKMLQAHIDTIKVKDESLSQMENQIKEIHTILETLSKTEKNT